MIKYRRENELRLDEVIALYQRSASGLHRPVGGLDSYTLPPQAWRSDPGKILVHQTS